MHKDEAEVLLAIKAYLTGAHNLNRLTSDAERIGLALERLEARLDYLGRQADIRCPYCGIAKCRGSCAEIGV